MSYPRNAASPERIAIGPVILIADGTPQGSGVTITVRGQGGAEASGGGTTAYGATGVIVYYTPTQAETNFTSFTVIASKASCIPVCVTIITSASATPGYAGVDWGFVANPTTSLALTGTTIAVTQKVDIETIKTNPVVNGGTITFPTTATLASTTNITAGTIATVTNLTNAPGAGDFTATMKTSIGTAVAASAVASVTGNVGGIVTGSVGSVVGAVGSVTGAVGSVTGAVGSVTGNVGGNVVGSVASVVGAVGSVTGLTASNLDATVSSRLASASITLSSGIVSADVKKINGVTIVGDGSGTPFNV